MGCNCAQRRALTAQAINNLRKGEINAAKQNAQRFVNTIRLDARNATRAIKSSLNIRPPR